LVLPRDRGRLAMGRGVRVRAAIGVVCLLGVMTLAGAETGCKIDLAQKEPPATTDVTAKGAPYAATPLADAIERDPDAIRKAYAEHALTDEETKLLAVYWATLIVAQQKGEIDPLMLA